MANHPVTFARTDDFSEVFEEISEDFGNSFGVSFESPVVDPWFPGIPSPSPFDTNRLSQRIVPRVPIRLDNKIRLTGANHQTGNQTSEQSVIGGVNDPKKIDPRLVRQTEIVQQILNGLSAAGWIYRTPDNGYDFAFKPRVIAGVDSMQGELFVDSTTNRLAYKNQDGSITSY